MEFESKIDKYRVRQWVLLEVFYVNITAVFTKKVKKRIRAVKNYYSVGGNKTLVDPSGIRTNWRFPIKDELHCEFITIER